MFKLKIICFVCISFLLSFGLQADVPVYITFLWHMHQPIYTPGDEPDDAYNTVLRNGGTPDGPLEGRTFSYSLHDMWASKGGPYRGWAVDAIEYGLDLPHLGAQIDLSGSLVESLNSLAYNNWNGGFYNNWKSRFYTGMNYKTVLGNPRLDVICFPYHHPLLGLLWENDIVVQFLCNIKLLQQEFPGYNSKGVFPPETSIAKWNIKALKQVGIEWVMVDNIHLFRTLSDYPWTGASGVVEPNKADQINGTAADHNSSWVQLNGLWAPEKVCMPWGYRPHYAQYIDPETGTAYKIMIIPAACYEGNEDARGGFGALNYPEVFGQYLPYNTDPNHPMIALLHHDGENYGAGSDSYYHANFANFCQWLRENPSQFVGTTIQDYLDTFPPDPDDIVHFESGGWIGSGCLSPEFHYWLADPDPYPTGYSPDWNSWAVITAARNWMMTAYAKVKGYGKDYFELTIDDPLISEILDKSTTNKIAKAFHYYIRSQASCYEYWEGGPDEDIWNANPTVACNKAIDIIKNELNVTTNDDYGIGPSIFLPQRQPYNPGGTEWGEEQPSDFEVWSFIYDLNGISSAVVKYRVSDTADGMKYTYSAGYDGEVPMQSEDLPPTQRPSTPVPYYRAKRYYATISGINNKYVDYWIEAVDTKGNVSKSPIMHVYVGQNTPSQPARWKPENPTQNDIITVYADKPGYLHWGVNGWTEPITNYWTEGTFSWGDGHAVESPLSSVSPYTINIGPFNNPAQPVSEINFVFHYNDGTWDNNNGQDYLIPITIQTGDSPPSAPQGLSAKIGCSKVYLQWNQNTEPDVWKYNIYRKTAGGSYINTGSVLYPTNFYYDTSVVNGTTYYYYITAVDTGTNESSGSIEVSATPQQNPQPPSGVSIYLINGNEVKLTWNFNPEIDISKYKIYRSTTSGSGYNLISTLGSNLNYFIDGSVSSYTTYYYVITALNQSGYESSYSVEKSIYIPGGEPSPPQNLMATSQTDKVYLIWDENTETDFWYYAIYRTNIPGITNFSSPIATLTNRTNNNYTDLNVTNGGTYYYKLRAVNSNGQFSSFSEEVKVTVDACPAPPRNLSATAGDGYVLLTWSPNIETNIKEYKIYRDTDSTITTDNYLTTVASNITSYNDTDVINGTTYYYALKAVNILELYSDFSEIVSATPNSNVILPPSPVENFTVENIAEGERLLLTWVPPETNFAGVLIIRNIEGINKYPDIPYGMPENGVSYSEGEQFGDQGIVVYSGYNTVYTDTGLINGNTYYYIIYAYNSEFIYSQPRYAHKKCSDLLSPPAPVLIKLLSGYNFIDIIWHKIKEEVFYTIYRKTEDDKEFSNISGYITETNYRDSTVEPGITYYYYVKAIDHSYNSSEASDILSKRVGYPIELKASAGYGYISLQWKECEDDYILGYNIYRKKSNETEWQKMNSEVINKSTYQDKAIEDGAIYNYLVKAVDIYGNESKESESITIQAIKFVKERLEIRQNVIKPNEAEENKAIIYYQVNQKAKVTIKIYDVNGRLIKTLVNTELEPKSDGTPYVTEWDATDRQKEIVGTGVYFCVIDINGKRTIKRIVVIK